MFICCYCHQETNKCKTFLCTIIVIKPIELLVLVSFMHYCTSTSNLSTWWSSTTLMGKSSIQVGFPLRCFQRLSRPYIATQRCSWRNNWYTRGANSFHDRVRDGIGCLSVAIITRKSLVTKLFSVRYCNQAN